MEIKYEVLPEHMRDSARRYIEDGIKPGEFLTAVLMNDLKESFGRADDINAEHMKDWVIFLYNCAPIGCQGNEYKVNKWIKSGGLNGLRSYEYG